MNLQSIRNRFAIFLKQFRIEDLKLLMRFLELIVNEYKNSKASRLFDLLSHGADCPDHLHLESSSYHTPNERNKNFQKKKNFEISRQQQQQQSTQPNDKMKQPERRKRARPSCADELFDTTKSSEAEIASLLEGSSVNERNSSDEDEEFINEVAEIEAERAKTSSSPENNQFEHDQLLDQYYSNPNESLVENEEDELDNDENDDSKKTDTETANKRIRIEPTQGSNIIKKLLTQQEQEEPSEDKSLIKCAVCSDTASGTRYGVCVCEGCKEFFRRQRENVNVKMLQCVNGTNECKINVKNRTQCRRCRFEKCLRLGMKLVGRYYRGKDENSK